MWLRFGGALLAIMLLPHVGGAHGLGSKAWRSAAGIRHRQSPRCGDQSGLAGRVDRSGETEGQLLPGSNFRRQNLLRSGTCRGQALDWLSAVPTLIVPPHELLSDLPLVERRAPTSSEVAEGLSESPDVPPPEVA